MDRERRKRERVAVHFDVVVMLGAEIIQVQILNISLTGILCTSHPLFSKGCALQGENFIERQSTNHDQLKDPQNR